MPFHLHILHKGKWICDNTHSVGEQSGASGFSGRACRNIQGALAIRTGLYIQTFRRHSRNNILPYFSTFQHLTPTSPSHEKLTAFFIKDIAGVSQNEHLHVFSVSTVGYKVTEASSHSPIKIIKYDIQRCCDNPTKVFVHIMYFYP